MVIPHFHVSTETDASLSDTDPSEDTDGSTASGQAHDASTTNSDSELWWQRHRDADDDDEGKLQLWTYCSPFHFLVFYFRSSTSG